MAASTFAGLIEMPRQQLSMHDVTRLVHSVLLPEIRTGAVLFGVPRNGVPLAMLAAAFRQTLTVEDPQYADIIIDDFELTGATRRDYEARYPRAKFLTLLKRTDVPRYGDHVPLMPWEAPESANPERLVRGLLELIGEDPDREGLLDTPARVVKAWKEWASGYQQDPVAILKSFTDGAEQCDEMVIVHNIPVVSKCEHHMADITGIAHVGYIPNGRILGLSKLPRLVDIYARRLQVQERLTNQIANALEDHLQPIGVGVIIRAAHACMSSRGVKIHGSVTTTSAVRGAIKSKAAARDEFLHLCRDAENHRG